MGSYSTILSAQILAFAAVQRGDNAFLIRHIFRWYSKTFSTPLHMVDDLPFEEVLQAYYESEFEGMSEEDRLEVAERLLQTDEDRLRASREKDAAEADDFDAEQQMAAHERRKKNKKKKPGTIEDARSSPVEGGLLGADIAMPPVDHLPLRNTTPDSEVSVKFMSDQQVAGFLAQDERDG